MVFAGSVAAKPGVECPAGTTYAEGWSGFERATWCAKKDGTRHGPYRLWYDTQKLKEEGLWDAGTMAGRWTAWWPSGKKKSEGLHEKNQREGLWTQWHDNGQPEIVSGYRAGVPDGEWTKWWRNGNKAEEGAHRNGQRIGRWTTWYENGNKQTEGGYRFIEKFGTVEDGKWAYYYSNGRRKAEGPLAFGMRNGAWSEFSDSGKERVVVYKFGMTPEEWDAYQKKAAYDAERTKEREALYNP